MLPPPVAIPPLVLNSDCALRFTAFHRWYATLTHWVGLIFTDLNLTSKQARESTQVRTTNMQAFILEKT
jgi:hypothetical protein